MKTPRLTLLTASAAALVTLTSSCSTMPTAPSAAANAAVSRSPSAELLVPEPPPVEIPSGSPVVSASGSAVIDGKHGGTVEVGRWLVEVLPNTFQGVGTVTLSIPDVSVAACNLEITPGSLNDFRKDVQLNYRWDSRAEAKLHDMRYFNATTGAWEVVESWTQGASVYARIRHFSSYRSG